MVSVNICPDSTAIDCGQVKLHYDSKGLDLEGAEAGPLAINVQPIKLQNGWVLAFDSTSKNILAFRGIEPVQGVPYRAADVPDANFGLGNGVLLSVVARGVDLAQELDTVSEPIVTQFFEIEPNKVLLFFSTVRAVHMLDLTEVTEQKVFDLNRPTQTRFDVQMLRGTIEFFGAGDDEAFLEFRRITEITQNDELLLDTFQPLPIPDLPTSVPQRGIAFVFDQSSSDFVELLTVKDAVGQIIGGDVRLAVDADLMISVLEGGSGSETVSGPFVMTGGFANPDPNSNEVVWFEQETKNLLAYNYRAPIDSNVRIFVPAANLLIRRGQGGELRNTVASAAGPGLCHR